MPRDERKRQKALMKQRSEQKVAAQHKAHLQVFTPSYPKASLRHAREYPLSQYLLAPRGELAESYKLTFGKEGKPFFIAGAYDNVGRILRQFDKTAGPGNYHYMTMNRW